MGDGSLIKVISEASISDQHDGLENRRSKINLEPKGICASCIREGIFLEQTSTTIGMVFSPPDWVLPLPFDPPDSISISEFMLNEKYGRRPFSNARAPFICGLTGTEYSALEVRDRVDRLARALSKELGWYPNRGTEWDKIVGVFSVNTVCIGEMVECLLRLIPWRDFRLTRSRYVGQFIPSLAY